MFRINRETDYGILLLACMARSEKRSWSATALADELGLPQPMVSKILKLLARSGVLDSRRGPKGGYLLARPAALISAADMIAALEGPIALTECSAEEEPGCAFQSNCQTSGHWMRINRAIRDALEKITLSELSEPGGLPAEAIPAVPIHFMQLRGN